MSELCDLAPPALQVRVSRGRKGVDLSTAAQILAFTDYAQKNGRMVLSACREW